MIISKDTEKVSDKVQCLFMTKIVPKLGQKEPFQSDKGYTYIKILVNILFITETLKAFPLRLVARQECLPSPLAVHHCTDIPS